MFRNLLSKKKANQDGVIVVSILSVSIVLTIVGVSILSYSLNYLSRVQSNVFFFNAIQVAEAGIEKSLYFLNNDDDFEGFLSEVEPFPNTTQGRGVFTSLVVDKEDSNVKEIISVGKFYRNATSEEPESVRTIKATVVGTASEGYSVHTGPGGLILGGSASITNSDVFVNGRLTLNGASSIGTFAQPLDVYVAHQSCPAGNNPGSTYPQVCSSGQPITTAWSTTIFGSVCATNQTVNGPRPGGNILPGSNGSGLQIGCTAPPVSPPPYDRAKHIADVEISSASNNNLYVCNNWPFNRSWPANIQFNGNMSIGGSCDITINGDAYISGHLTIGGASRIRVSDAVGSNRPVIIVDGDITLGGSAQLISNDQGTGIHFISFRSNASCNPNCTELTGNALRNTQDLQTVNIGGAVNLPGMIFQSYWGRARLGGSGSVGSIIGQTVDMSGAGTVTFGTVLASGTKTWTLSSYQPVFGDNEEE